MRKLKKNRIIPTLFIILLLLLIFSILIFIKNKNNQSCKIPLKDIDNKSYEVSWSEDSEPVVIQNNYKVKMDINVEENYYILDMTVTFINDSNDVWNYILLRDYPSYFINVENGKLSEIYNIRNERSGNELSMQRNLDDNTVFCINLDIPLNPGELAQISMNYKAYIPNLNARYGFQIIDEKTKDFYLGNCIPILCPYENGEFIHHTYFSVGECFYSKMANYEVTIIAPEDYTIIASGNEINTDNSENHTYIANASRDFCVVVGNNYNCVTKELDGIEINSYYHPGRKKEGNAALNTAISAMDTINKRLGKYPYKKFSVVEAQMEMLGMEYPNMVLISMNESGVDSTYHETIHQWFYLLVGNDSYLNAWIDESIVTYLTNPGLDEYTGIITKPYNYFADDSDYTLAMYFCGASFYNKLETKYGQTTMDNFMKEYLKLYAYKECNTQELVNLLKKFFGDDEILHEYIDNIYL